VSDGQKVDGAVSRALLLQKISSYINVKQAKNPDYDQIENLEHLN
jgi:hypothetical protein